MTSNSPPFTQLPLVYSKHIQEWFQNFAMTSKHNTEQSPNQPNSQQHQHSEPQPLPVIQHSPSLPPQPYSELQHGQHHLNEPRPEPEPYSGIQNNPILDAEANQNNIHHHDDQFGAYEAAKILESFLRLRDSQLNNQTPVLPDTAIQTETQNSTTLMDIDIFEPKNVPDFVSEPSSPSEVESELESEPDLVIVIPPDEEELESDKEPDSGANSRVSSSLAVEPEPKSRYKRSLCSSDSGTTLDMSIKMPKYSAYEPEFRNSGSAPDLSASVEPEPKSTTEEPSTVATSSSQPEPESIMSPDSENSPVSPSTVEPETESSIDNPEPNSKTSPVLTSQFEIELEYATCKPDAVPTTSSQPKPEPNSRSSPSSPSPIEQPKLNPNYTPPSSQPKQLQLTIINPKDIPLKCTCTSLRLTLVLNHQKTYQIYSINCTTRNCLDRIEYDEGYGEEEEEPELEGDHQKMTILLLRNPKQLNLQFKCAQLSLIQDTTVRLRKIWLVDSINQLEYQQIEASTMNGHQDHHHEPQPQPQHNQIVFFCCKIKSCNEIRSEEAELLQHIQDAHSRVDGREIVYERIRIPIDD